MRHDRGAFSAVTAGPAGLRCGPRVVRGFTAASSITGGACDETDMVQAVREGSAPREEVLVQARLLQEVRRRAALT